MGTFFVGIMVLLAAVCAGRSVYKNKKAGKCSGGCSGCSGCSGACQMSREKAE